MALGVDMIQGSASDVRADTVEGSLAKAVLDKVDSYATKQDDVVEMTTRVFGGHVFVMILHV